MGRPTRIPEKGDTTAVAITLRRPVWDLARRACGWRAGTARRVRLLVDPSERWLMSRLKKGLKTTRNAVCHWSG